MRLVGLIISAILVFPLYVVVQICRRVFRNERAFVSAANHLSLVPGVLGDFLRKAYYRLTLERFALTAGVGFGSYFSHSGASMRDGSSCGAYCILGMCAIGEGVLIGSNVHVLSGKDQHLYDADGKLIDGTLTRVTIGDYTWIGNGAIVMASVGARCIVGAGAVVINDVPDDSVAVGNPARLIKRSNHRPQ